jgi:hypothetical protein
MSRACFYEDGVKTLGQIVLVVGAIVLAFVLYVFWPDMRHAGRIGDPQHMTAEIKLINAAECHMQFSSCRI